MSTTLKRKFKSSIVYVKVKKVKKENVEDLVVSCYVNTIIVMVESFSTEWCNDCHCKFAEKVDIFYNNVIIRLEKENTSVIKKFEKSLETNRELYDEEDVENALKMLKCAIHRRRMCTDNYIYFKNMIINELCA